MSCATATEKGFCVGSGSGLGVGVGQLKSDIFFSLLEKEVGTYSWDGGEYGRERR